MRISNIFIVLLCMALISPALAPAAEAPVDSVSSGVFVDSDVLEVLRMFPGEKFEVKYIELTDKKSKTIKAKGTISSRGDTLVVRKLISNSGKARFSDTNIPMAWIESIKPLKRTTVFGLSIPLLMLAGIAVGVPYLLLR